MDKIMSKLIASILALTVAASLVAMSSYAWLTLSGAPEVDGIQVNIGGSNTIMVAADMVVVEADGSVHHYPGAFDQTLVFSRYETYDYLQDITGLTPVSTSDGVNWILPDYYKADDELVQSGLAMDGQLKDYADFILDETMDHANLTVEEKELAKGGNYVFLDFWVVSPGSDYKLRVSTGDVAENSGSYVIGLMEPTEIDNDGDGISDGYALEMADQTVPASVRVGFLINQDPSKYTDTLYYIASEDYDERYTYLLGQYQDPGQHVSQFSAATNRFTIYEPNADLHPGRGDGDYRITSPLGVKNGVIAPQNVSKILTVQKSNLWKMSANGMGTMIEQEFQTAVVTQTFRAKRLEDLHNMFYVDRLQGQLAPYINRGRFIANTAELYAAADPATGIVEQGTMALSNTAGATDDVYITTLQKDIPQRIRMFIWLEGQDEDCRNHVNASSFAINIELAGSNNG